MKRRTLSIEALPQPYGKYELLERIGSGGMAEVYRARQQGVGGFQKTVVIKRLRPKHASDEALSGLFIEEAKLAADVHHPNIVQVFELGELEHGELYIAMEYVPGSDLRRLLEHAAKAERPVPAWLSVHVAIEVLKALEHAHALVDEAGRPRNLVHCDVTPENVFLSRDGDVKLGDFGVAHDDTRAKSTLSDQAKGKLPYMSPEQVLEQPIDARSDLFSLAVMLWESLSRRRLFPGRTPSEVMAQVCASPRPPPSRYARNLPARLDRVILEALSPDREDRFASAAEFRVALEPIASEMQPTLVRERVKAALTEIMDAPLIHSEPPELEDEDEDGLDELDALDMALEGPEVLIEAPDIRFEESDRPVNLSTPRPAHIAAQTSFREIEPTKPRLQAVPRPPSVPSWSDPFRKDDSSTYRIIRGQSSAEARDAESIMQAYLEDELSPVPRSSPSWAGSTRTPPPVLAEASPIYVRTGGSTHGPMPLGKMLERAELHAQRGRGSFAVSPDAESWMSFEEFARLLGEAPLGSGLPDSMSTEEGRLAERSFVEIIGSLAHEGRTGRLLLWSDRGVDRDRIELHLKDGALTHARWTTSPFDVWRSVLDDVQLSSHGFEAILGLALSTHTDVLPRLAPAAVQAIRDRRARFAQRHFERAVASVNGGFAFDPDAEPMVTTEAQSILRLLPQTTFQALSHDEIERRLGGRLDRPHRFGVDELGLRTELGLSAVDASAIMQLENRPLGTAAKALEKGAQGKMAWVLAYLLAELGMLQER